MKLAEKLIRVRDAHRGGVYDLRPEQPILRVTYVLFRTAGPMRLRGDLAEWTEDGTNQTSRVARATLGDTHPGERVLVQLEPGEDWWLCDAEQDENSLVKERERKSVVPRSAEVSDSTVPPEAAEGAAPEWMVSSTFRRILVPIDFSPLSKRALATALLLQDRMQSEVHLFHLTEQGANAEFLASSGANVSYVGLAEEAKERLVRFVENVFPGRSHGVTPHGHAGVDLVRAIESVAREVDATLVLLAGHPRQTLFRTHIEKVARDLPTAIMVLWADRESI